MEYITILDEAAEHDDRTHHRARACNGERNSNNSKVSGSRFRRRDLCWRTQVQDGDIVPLREQLYVSKVENADPFCILGGEPRGHDQYAHAYHLFTESITVRHKKPRVVAAG